jgi:hypothetical protein
MPFRHPKLANLGFDLSAPCGAAPFYGYPKLVPTKMHKMLDGAPVDVPGRCTVGDVDSVLV